MQVKEYQPTNDLERNMIKVITEYYPEFMTCEVATERLADDYGQLLFLCEKFMHDTNFVASEVLAAIRHVAQFMRENPIEAVSFSHSEILRHDTLVRVSVNCKRKE